MKRINICGIIILLAIIGVFVWQLVSLTSLYHFDKKNFCDKVNGAVYSTVYKLNVLRTDEQPSGNFVGVDPASFRVVYCRGEQRDTIAFDPALKLVDVLSQAMYDIHASTWTLKKLDTLFQEYTRETIGEIPIYFCLKDSTGDTLQSLGDKGLIFDGVKGVPVPLGLIMKHELNYTYAYSTWLFIREEIHSVILLLLLFFTIISALIALFRSLKQSREEARYGEMVIDTITHNLHTPIVNVLKNMSRLQETGENKMEKPDKELQEEILEELRGISETATRLLNLNNIMDGIKVKARDTNLPDLLNRIINRYKRHFYSSGKKVEFLPHFNIKNKIIQLDPNYFTEIAQNLIDNSIKYSGDEVQISISCEEHGNKVIIRFSDNGYGMTNEFLKRAFQPHTRHTDKNSETPSGYGLGLFSVRQAVKAHGGTIKVNSRKNEGSEFIITLPRKSRFYAED